MATYNFHGGNQEMETTDGLHTLYLMNPNYTTSHHHHHQAATTRQNMILLNSSLPHALSHAPPQPQSQFLTIPFAHPIDDPTRSAGNSFHYNLWGSGSGSGQVVEVSSSGALGVAATHPYQIQIDNNDTDMFRRPAVVSPTINQQGLSLSLSSQPRLGGGGGNNGNSYNNNSSSGGGGGGGFGSTSSAAHQAEDSNGVHNLIMGSKYLKAAQELLDEVVNVGKGSTTTITANDTVKKEKEKVVQMDNNNNINGESEAAAGNNGSNNRAASSELTVTQRQELQMKKTKLISMLDEVEQTYRQYNHQMKTVVSSFEQVAGLGSARSYTSLALTTISKQFRCLKDAIMSQIKQISKSLGEEDCLAEGSSRLRMIDHQLRQQRALQQLGMIQHNAWRPQRGLPERAVSVLRAWLFENFLHPYPKDSDKHILAKRTGLTRNQVSNWFINARVRLWKPMVEEMYLEEVKDQPAEQKDSNSIQDNNNALVTIAKSSPADKQQQQPQNAADHISNSTTMSTSPNNNNNIASSFNALAPPGFTLASSDMDGLVQYKKLRGAAVQETTQNHSPSSILSASGEMSFSRQDQSSNLTAKFGAYSTGYDNNNNSNNGGGFGAYHQFGDQVGSRFNPDEQLFHHGNNNGSVSLTLGLPPGENLAHNNYFSGHGYDRGLQMGGNGADDFCGINNTNNPQNSNMGFQNMDIQNRKNYAAQLLPDFVA